jgi:hypothetical protein
MYQVRVPPFHLIPLPIQPAQWKAGLFPHRTAPYRRQSPEDKSGQHPGTSGYQPACLQAGKGSQTGVARLGFGGGKRSLVNLIRGKWQHSHSRLLLGGKVKRNKGQDQNEGKEETNFHRTILLFCLFHI